MSILMDAIPKDDKVNVQYWIQTKIIKNTLTLSHIYLSHIFQIASIGLASCYQTRKQNSW